MSPRLHTRITKLQQDVIKTITAAQEVFGCNHLFVAQYLKLRDFTGRSAMTLLIESKVYEFFQVQVIEAAIKTLWLGKANFGGKFMQ